MNFKIPYILTFFSLLCYSYMLSSYAYSQTNVGQIFKISTTEFGIIYSLSSLISIFAGFISIYYTIKITNNLVTVFCLANLGFTLPYLIVIGIPLICQYPHKVFVYIALFVLNFFRTFYFPLVVLMVKKHKEIAQIKDNIVQSNHRLMIMVWAIGYDIGMVLGFFVSNWLDETFNWNWKQLMIIGIILGIVNVLLIWVILKEYLEPQQSEIISQKQTEPYQINDEQSISHTTTFPVYLKMLKNQPAILLFSINTILLHMKDATYTLILPMYFYKIGYSGKQGYLVAVWSTFIIIGSMMFSLSDFIRQKINQYFDQQNQKQPKYQAQQEKILPKNQKRNMKISEFIQSPVSLFCFFVVTLLIALDSINKKQTSQIEKQNYTLQLVYMCLMGLFFGGPANEYFSYQFIRVMGQLEDVYETKYMRKQIEDKNMEKLEQSGQKYCFSSLSWQWRNHKLKISTLYINMKYILFQGASMPFYLSTFYIIERYTSLLFFLLSMIALIIFVFDLAQNILTYKVNRVKSQYLQVKDPHKLSIQ